MRLEILKKLYLYAKNISNTGAIYETSFAAAREITKYVDINKKQVIVEFGSGTGSITKLIKEKMHPDSQLYCFEANNDMVDYLRKHFQQENIIIFHKSAWEFKNNIAEPVDIVISSLPISFFSKKEMDELLVDVNDRLKKDGVFSQIVYNYFYLNKVKKKFSMLSKKTMFKNFPPAHVFHVAKFPK